MQDRQLYEQILGIHSPWYVDRVELQLDKAPAAVRVYLNHQPRRDVELCRMWSAVRSVRSPARETMATFGYLSVPDDPACGATANEMPATRAASGEVAMGRTGQPIYGASRASGDRLAEGGQPEGGGRTTPSELG